MRIVKVGVLAPTNKGIPLGVQGENRATQVEFDTRPWFREYPYGTVSAVARRDGDPAPYPLSLDVADGTAVWQVSDTDTAKVGVGAVELTMTSGGARVRSLTFKTLVTASLTDSPVDDDAWYGWLDKAVVKVDETVQSAQRKMDEVDLEWTALKADMTEKVEECGEVAEQAATDAHHAKVDAQATAKALESAEGSVAKAEAAANRAVDAALASDDSAVEASKSALSARESAEAASGSATNAATSASEAATSAGSAADAASSASGSASSAAQSATDASNAKVAAQTAKADAATSAGNAATSASNADKSAKAAAKSASDAAASVGAINVIAPKSVDVAANSSGYKALSIGDTATAVGQGSVAIGYKASSAGLESIAIGDTANASEPFAVALGELSAASAGGSIAVGYNSKANAVNEFSVGSDELTREITHVSAPTGPNSASTKKYTDDNDAKTLSEAKKYTDDNTSNALVGNVSGKLLHVDDAWPSPLLSVTIEGAYKQDGTPSPESPAPIQVIENPTLKVSGKNYLNANLLTDLASFDLSYEHYGYYIYILELPVRGDYTVSVGNTNSSAPYLATSTTKTNVGAGKTWFSHPSAPLTTTKTYTDIDVIYIYFGSSVDKVAEVLKAVGYIQVEAGTQATAYKPYVGTSLPFTLPAEHPYLAALPDGTHDEIVIDKDGNASLVARVRRISITNDGKWRYEKTGGGASIYYTEKDGKMKTPGLTPCAIGRYGYAENVVFVGNNGFVTLVDSDATNAAGVIEKFGENNPVYYQPATPIYHSLGKLDIPALPETISNVWTEAELATNMSMTYKRDINVAFDNLVQAVVAAAAGE